MDVCADGQTDRQAGQQAGRQTNMTMITRWWLMQAHVAFQGKLYLLSSFIACVHMNAHDMLQYY